MDESTRVPVVLVNKSTAFDVRVPGVADSAFGPLRAVSLPRAGASPFYFEGYMPARFVAPGVLAHHVALGYDVARPVHVALTAAGAGAPPVAGLPGFALDAARSNALNYADGSVAVDLYKAAGEDPAAAGRLRVQYAFERLPPDAVSAGGVRRDGAFACFSGRAGKFCEVPAANGLACAGRGLPVYDAGDATRFLRCDCVPPFGGPSCDCPVDAAGAVCSGRGTCDPELGVCVCAPGFAGAVCEVAAQPWLLFTFINKPAADGTYTRPVQLWFEGNADVRVTLGESTRVVEGQGLRPFVATQKQVYLRAPSPPSPDALEFTAYLVLRFLDDGGLLRAPFVLRRAGAYGPAGGVGGFSLVNGAVPAGAADPIVTLAFGADGTATITLLRVPDLAAVRCDNTAGVRDLQTGACACFPGRGGPECAGVDFGAAMWADGETYGYCVEGVQRRAGEAGAALAALAAAYPVGDAHPLHFIGKSCPRAGATELRPGFFRYALPDFPPTPDAAPRGPIAPPVSDAPSPALVDCAAVGEDTPVRVQFGAAGGVAYGCIEGRRCAEVRDAMAALGVRGTLEGAFVDTPEIVSALTAAGGGALRDPPRREKPLACPAEFFGTATDRAGRADTVRYGAAQLPVLFSRAKATTESFVDVDTSASRFCTSVTRPSSAICEKCETDGDFAEALGKRWLCAGPDTGEGGAGERACVSCGDGSFWETLACDLGLKDDDYWPQYRYVWNGYREEDKVPCCLGLVSTTAKQTDRVLPGTSDVEATEVSWRCRRKWCAGATGSACTEVMLDYCSRTVEDPRLCRTATNLAGGAPSIGVGDAQTPMPAARTCSVVAASDELPLAVTCRAWVDANPEHGKLLYDRICQDPVHRYRLECACRNADSAGSDPWRFYEDRGVTQRSVFEAISAAGGGVLERDVGCWAPACVNSFSPTAFPFPADVYLQGGYVVDDRGGADPGTGVPARRPVSCNVVNCVTKVGEWISAGRDPGATGTIAQSCGAI